MPTLPNNTDELLAQGRAMIAQTKAEGSKAFTGSTYDKKAPVSSLSTTSGQQTYQETLDKFNKLPAAQTPPVTEPAKTETKVPVATFTNDQGQEAVYTQEQLNDPNIQAQLKAGGYAMAKTEGPTLLAGEKTVAEQQVEDLANQIKNYNVETDPLYATKTKEIQAKYVRLKEEMKQANAQRAQAFQTLGLRTGASRYTGSTQMGIEGEELSQANQRLADLDSQEQEEIANAREAIRTGKYTQLYNTMNALEKVRANKKEALDDYNKVLADKLKVLQEEKKALQEQKQKTRDKIDDVLKEAAKGGAPKEILDAIGGSSTLSEAVEAADRYLETATGIVGEWKVNNRDREARGLPPISFDEYATIDANRKRSIVNINQAGMSPAQTQNYLRITDKYQADPIIMAATKGATAVKIADQVLADPNNAANQLKALYVLVKNLDPDSAVREGEINLAQQTQSYLDRFATNLSRVEKGVVISPKAAKELAEATKQLASAWGSSAQVRQKQYKSQANNADPVVGQAFGKYLTDFDGLQSTEEVVNNRSEQAKGSVVSKAQADTQLAGKVRSWLTQGLSYEDILQAYPEYFD